MVEWERQDWIGIWHFVAYLEKLKAELADKTNRERELRGFIDALTTSPLVLDAWDEPLWRPLVVKGTVGRDGGIEFDFIGGVTIKFEAS